MIVNNHYQTGSYCLQLIIEQLGRPTAIVMLIRLLIWKQSQTIGIKDTATDRLFEVIIIYKNWVFHKPDVIEVFKNQHSYNSMNQSKLADLVYSKSMLCASWNQHLNSKIYKTKYELKNGKLILIKICFARINILVRKTHPFV